MCKKTHIIYKIINTVNNKIYIGKHSTGNIGDGYLGSGIIILRAIKKYGIDKFEKEILFKFNTEEEAWLMEKKIVNNEFVKRNDTYNIKLGGHGGWDHLRGTATMKDKSGNIFRVDCNNQKCLSGELVGAFSGKHHTRKVKERISKSVTGTHVGKLNSQYGTCWIYNKELKESRKVKKEEVSNWLNIGWKVGRKIKW